MIPIYIRPQLSKSQFTDDIMNSALEHCDYSTVTVETARDTIFDWLGHHYVNEDTFDAFTSELRIDTEWDEIEPWECIDALAEDAEYRFLAEETVKYQGKLSPDAVKQAATQCGCTVPEEDLLRLLSNLAVFGTIWMADECEDIMSDMGTSVSQLIDIANAYKAA